MSYPKLAVPASGEVLLVCTCCEQGRADWGEVLDALGGRWDRETVVLGDSGIVLRLAEHPRWDYLHGGNFPALVEEGGEMPPVILLADIPAVIGGSPVLLVDLREVPGRGVRVEEDRLGRVLTGLLAGSLDFGELVRGMDRDGVYQGGSGAPVTPTPTTIVRTSFPRLPVSEATLLVRTDFTDDAAWAALVGSLGESEEADLAADIVDDRAFDQLQPGQVPALVPPDEHTTMVALADTVTMTDPSRPLLVVDLYDTPGQVTRIPLAEAETMAVTLEIGNLHFADFV